MSESSLNQREIVEPRVSLPGWAWALVAALIVVVLGGAAAIVAVGASSNDAAGARATAQKYLDAIAAGDADRANALSGVRAESSEAKLLTSEVLGHAERITGAKARVKVDGGSQTATGTATFTLNGSERQQTIRLERVNGGWRVVDGLRFELPLEWGSDWPIKLDGYAADISPDELLTAYPGVYTVRPSSDYFEVVGSDRMVVGPGPAWPDYDADASAPVIMPTSAFETAVQQQVEAAFVECAQQTSYDALSRCGINLTLPVTADLSTARLEVELVRAPTVTGYGSYYEVDADGVFRARLIQSGSADTEVAGTNYYADLDISVTDNDLDVELNFY